VSTILDIRGVREPISRLSVEEYHRLDEYNENWRRTELICGIVIEKTSKSPLHRIVCSRLYKLLLAVLPKGFSVWKEEPLTLADSEPEPDISVTRGDEKDFTTAHPSTAQLLIEVAVSSAALDRENAFLYAEASVEEYWIILGGSQKIEVYRNPRNGKYQEVATFRIGDVIESTSVPGMRIVVAEVFGEAE
jgi:Uma2 family endonuclease